MSPRSGPLGSRLLGLSVLGFLSASASPNLVSVNVVSLLSAAQHFRRIAALSPSRLLRLSMFSLYPRLQTLSPLLVLSAEGACQLRSSSRQPRSGSQQLRRSSYQSRRDSCPCCKAAFSDSRISVSRLSRTTHNVQPTTAFITAQQFVTTTKWFETTPQEFVTIPKDSYLPRSGSLDSFGLSVLDFSVQPTTYVINHLIHQKTCTSFWYRRI